MKKLAATLVVIVALLCGVGSAWADFDDGVAAQDRGDYVTALQEFLPLAEQGDAKAQFNLGYMYVTGKGVPKNYTEAFKWYRKAAEQGYSTGQYHLGLMYFEGYGVPVNNIKAYMWYSLAKAQGYKNVAHNLDIIEEEMTPAQITKAQALAAQMWEKISH